MDKFKLTYFDVSGGRAEPIRLALHIGGIPFEDFRFAFGEFEEIRKTTPLNQVPTIHINALQVTQADAITRYIGRLADLYPSDALQALLCDEVLSALEDINNKIVATFGMQGEALKAAREALVQETFPRYLRWLEAQLQSHGGEYLSDNRLTIADLKALVVLRWLGSGKLDHIPTNIVQTIAPTLSAYVDRIGATPAVVAYYDSLASK